MVDELNEPKDISEEYEAWRDELHRSVDAGEEFVIDYYNVRALSSRGVAKGKITRISRQFTLPKKTWDQFCEFMEIFTGTQPERGRGISSPLTDIALRLFMGMYAGLDTEKVVSDIVGTLNSRKDVKRLHRNLRELLEEMEQYFE